MNSSFWLVEKNLIKKHKTILAIDEAGRGAGAGPLAVGGLFLDRFSLKILEKNKIYFYDSKELTPQQREFSLKIIKKLRLPHKTILINNLKIDKMGINQALLEGVKKLIENFRPGALIMDGRKIQIDFKNSYFFVRGDKRLASLGGASILAKTKRDNYMIKIAKKYPEYLFEIHKGYLTKKHLQLIKKFGHCKLHRLSFLRNFISK